MIKMLLTAVILLVLAFDGLADDGQTGLSEPATYDNMLNSIFSLFSTESGRPTERCADLWRHEMKDVSYDATFWDRTCVVIGEVTSIVEGKKGEPNLLLDPHSTVSGTLDCGQFSSVGILVEDEELIQDKSIKAGDKLLIVLLEIKSQNLVFATGTLLVPSGFKHDLIDGGGLVQKINSYDDPRISTLAKRIRSLRTVSAERAGKKKAYREVFDGRKWDYGSGDFEFLLIR